MTVILAVVLLAAVALVAVGAFRDDWQMTRFGLGVCLAVMIAWLLLVLLAST